MSKTKKNNKLFAENIEIKGARVHNLKNINLTIERDKFTVITGLSGSGKSSLAFDTLYAEGQRRYVESLSSYARQFLGRLNKPEVDYIKGIPPAIAVEQKVNTRNPRSTVGTSTEIYDYLKLLYARTGETFSPVSGKKVKRNTVTDVIDYLYQYPKNTKAIILAPLYVVSQRTCSQQLQILLKQGFSRVEFDNEIYAINELLNKSKISKPKKAYIVIDRISISNNEDTISRIADSVQTSFFEGKGVCVIKVFGKEKTIKETFSNKFEADGITFEIPTVHTFSFNNPLGACPVCEGFGKTMGIDEDLVIPNKNLSVYEETVACWRGEKMSWYKDEFIKIASDLNFPIHRSYYLLTQDEKDILWYGKGKFKGLFAFFKMIEKKSRKIQYRVMLSRYRGKTVCYECKGTRLKKEASYIKVGGKSIHELVNIPINELIAFFNNISLNQSQKDAGERLLTEIKNRLQYLSDVGLSYLTLNRLSSTLSGGESQRINLASSLGSSLVGSLYILDEPSIGLHPKDTDLLIKVLKQLRDIGNTVIVVEHDEDIIKASDNIIDIGPLAGTNGGELVYQGTYKDLMKLNGKTNKSLTSDYLRNIIKVPVPKKRRTSKQFIELKGATHNNLKNIDIKIPLNSMTVVTGVSGSGKSSLIRDILYPALSRILNDFGKKPGSYSEITGNIKQIKEIIFVDQNPIGKSSRSNPVTYLKAFDEIRKLFASQQLSTINGYKPAHFSFNIDGGRCENCRGEGEITVEMQFMADVHLVCDECKGKRFKDDILDVKFKDKSIFDILELTVDEAFEFFSENNETKKITTLIKPLVDVGLGYVKLGQSSNTLSGGESQRVKLASFLSKEKSLKKTMFIFDEPTTGLHFHDINKLLQSFNALLDRGHSIVIIEHNLEVIKSADYIIDLGPEGGDKGGYLLFAGTPEQLIKSKKSYTGKYLKEKL
ncbi:MAG: excinuclease ABC subunit UvrA [Bacteroidales bacterium]|nr:excinuclease ABC subunit UvrA [Bacteroidales bacterium]